MTLRKILIVNFGLPKTCRLRLKAERTAQRPLVVHPFRQLLILLLSIGVSLLSSCHKDEVAVDAEQAVAGMVRIEGGTTLMGSEGTFQTPYGTKNFPEERPQKEIEVTGFWMDQTEVTIGQFKEFVDATGYITFAERPADIDAFPPEALANLPTPPFNNGAIIFNSPSKMTGEVTAPGSFLQWWKWDPFASWKSPEGAGSDISGRKNHPVSCVTYDDAVAYANWAGKRLPTEAEWEYAARGGLEGKLYTWGDELKVDNKWMANTFHGKFPTNDTAEDGFAGPAPVKSFPPNAFGLYDMAGNVWEICSDYYDPAYRKVCKDCDPKGPETWVNRGTGEVAGGAPNYVTKGGSYLCHISYCMRYRPGARHSIENDSPACHTGFRCVKDL